MKPNQKTQAIKVLLTASGIYSKFDKQNSTIDIHRFNKNSNNRGKIRTAHTSACTGCRSILQSNSDNTPQDRPFLLPPHVRAHRQPVQQLAVRSSRQT
jgi:hypothetical protein